jgi:succinylglutamic semialdehyde dehydrogenase
MSNYQAGVFTNHEWQQGSGATFISYNPANEERLWQGRAANKQDVHEAVMNAKKAFPEWSSLSIDERSQYLNHFIEVLQQKQQHLANIISKETGKPLWESTNEVSSMINKVVLSFEAYGRRCAGMMRDQAQGRSITRHRPHGVIAIFGPFNFPGHLPNGHIIPALIAGNTIVFKPSELTPLVAEETIKCWEKCELPKGVINLVQGGIDTGQALANHPDINGLFFTGSYKTGKLLSETFGSQVEKILALEMGGNNPLIIGTEFDLKTAAFLTIQSAYLSSGQRCTCARRLIIPEGKNGDEFIKVLIDMTKTIVIGSYTDNPEPYMGPVINEQQVKHILHAQNALASKGGIPLIEMKHLKSGTGFINPGLMDVTPITDRPDEEIFGPFLQLIRVKNFEEAIEEANRTHYGLAAGLLSNDNAEYQLFYRSIRAGIINWNTQLTGASSTAPFGGIGWSGNYRPSAYYAADYCSYPVASLETNQMKMPIQTPPGIKLD